MFDEIQPTRRIAISRKLLLILLAALLCFLIAQLPWYFRVKKSSQWPSVPGVMTASWIRAGSCKGMPCYHGEIAYRYQVGDIHYTGTSFGLGPTHWAAQDSWQKELDRYPIGKAVRVYYDPRNPANGVLEPGLFGETEDAYKIGLGLTWFFGLSFIGVLLWYHDPEVSIADAGHPADRL